MTDQELQDLSREAAGCLPKDTDICYSDGTLYRPHIDTNLGPDWLHESNEACYEILVKELLPKDCDFQFMGGGCRYKEGADWVYIYFEDGDPMRAANVCILRALVALKGNKG